MPRNLLTADQTARRLGVKLETVYAYVSRGQLSRSLSEDGRTSRFDTAEVEALARRGRPRQERRRQGTIDVSLATAVTGIRDDRLLFRGHDASKLAAESTFEAVAELLWTRVLPDAPRWASSPGDARLVAAATKALPASAGLLDRLATAAVVLGAARPLRIDLSEASVTEHARALLSAYVAALPAVSRLDSSSLGRPERDRQGGHEPRERPARPAPAAHVRGSAARLLKSDGPNPELRKTQQSALTPRLLRRKCAKLESGVATAREPGGYAAKLFPRFSPLSPSAARISVLNAALVVLADHELATSTFAARVAASTRADPFAVVLAGLGAVSGPLHGKAAVAAHRMIADAVSSSAELAVARAIETVRFVPGFGHPVYKGTDPRAACLFGHLPALAKPSVVDKVNQVVRAGTKSAGALPNVDFALAAVAVALDMPVGATEALFAIARTAGWIAHALEEYGEAPLRFRASSLYIGESP